MHTAARCAIAAVSLVVTMASAGCSGEISTGIQTPPSSRRVDGGFTMGSGNVVNPGLGGTNNATAADTGSTARSGGITLGSGN